MIRHQAQKDQTVKFMLIFDWFIFMIVKDKEKKVIVKKFFSGPVSVKSNQLSVKESNQ